MIEPEFIDDENIPLLEEMRIMIASMKIHKRKFLLVMMMLSSKKLDVRWILKRSTER